jgi:hypothetical protein
LKEGFFMSEPPTENSFVSAVPGGFTAGVGLGRFGGELSAEGIQALDWLRLVDLLRGVASEWGWELAGSKVQVDGSVIFGMLEGVAGGTQRRVLVKVLSWNHWGADQEQVAHFAAEVRTVAGARGILVAPAGFSLLAEQLARQLHVEMVDAVSLHAALQKLPPERVQFLWSLATAGDAWTPTCPVCMSKLRREQVRRETELVQEEERILAADALIAEEVYCRRLWVGPGCEVQFLLPVRAVEAEILGRVHGDLVCDGVVRLGPEGMLQGSVAARGLQAEDGAEVLATLTVLQGPPPPPVRVEVLWQWRCRNSGGRDGCAQVAFEPHEGGVNG